LRTGTVNLTINTQGTGLDADGYRLRIDDGAERAVAPNGVVVLTDLHEGAHRLMLSDVADNCALAGGSEHTVNVAYAVTTTYQLSIGCSSHGTLKITTITTGLDLDADGYTVSFGLDPWDYGGLYNVTVPANGSASLAGIAGDSYQLDVGGVAANCHVASITPPNVVIQDQVVTSVSLNVVCFGKSTLEITGSTTGIDLDPDGYSVDIVSRFGSAGTRSANVPTNGKVSLTGVLGGSYSLLVGGWAPNCELAGVNPRDIIVDDKAPTSISLNVYCVAAKRLAFVVNAGATSYVSTINSNGTGSTRLTTGNDADPAWSPDGSTIAFATSRDGAFRIYLMNADGSNQRPLTSTNAPARQPTWAPDGQKIAFVGTAPDGDSEIYVMNADGSNVVRLTQSPGDDSDPAWSPDGRKIAFRSDRSGGGELYVMNVDGSNVVRLTTTSVDEHRPAWSPDGSRIVFAAGPCDDYNGCYSDLYIMNADGSATSQVTSGGVSFSPAWSPDGAWIAFVRTQCHNGSCDELLSIVQPNGAARGTVTIGHAARPAWHP
jgi:hypothetical protein